MFKTAGFGLFALVVAVGLGSFAGRSDAGDQVDCSKLSKHVYGSWQAQRG